MRVTELEERLLCLERHLPTQTNTAKRSEHSRQLEDVQQLLDNVAAAIVEPPPASLSRTSARDKTQGLPVLPTGLGDDTEEKTATISTDAALVRTCTHFLINIDIAIRALPLRP